VQQEELEHQEQRTLSEEALAVAEAVEFHLQTCKQEAEQVAMQLCHGIFQV
jgi:hypothetical protein